jgi:ADP-ribose pyrophosphatase YjhB (NUDIX family)
MKFPNTVRSSFAAGVLRRAFHTYWRFSRGLTMGVRGVVLDDTNRVFLIRHTYVPGWHLPGGGVETGETTEEALRRELLEEGCIRIDAEPVTHGVFFNSGASKRDHVVVYVIRSYTLVSQKIPDREIAEAGFFPLTALPETTTQATRRRLAEIVDGQTRIATW